MNIFNNIIIHQKIRLKKETKAPLRTEKVLGLETSLVKITSSIVAYKRASETPKGANTRK
jgi:hypothetical protein